MKNLFTTVLCLVIAGISFAQQPNNNTQSSPTLDLSKYIEDTRSVESVISAFLETVSGSKNQDRDWIRFANLFTDTADLAIVRTDKNGKTIAQSVPLNDFIVQNGPAYRARGFNQVELSRQITEWNGIASALQAYEWSVEDSDYKVRGIHNYQLIYSGDRWYISNLVFSSENESTPIPAGYPSRN